MTLHLLYGERLLKRLAPSCRNIKRLSLIFALMAFALSISCKIDERQSGIPPAAQDAINIFTDDFNAGQFDKIYSEAAEQWRARVTLEQSNQTFNQLKEALGALKERTYTSGRQQQNPSGNLSVNSLVLRYNTKFERAEGMETFTLIERDGRYLLAGYSVNSNLLRPAPHE